ncbi:flavin oxidoreductase [Pokkaliibacter plantistimulans]|uniref:Flavin oxidoreductase n=1 Tax=Proteobacteria bacterium 228 TaxID=2083153 RepID=A0A2S5KVC5_9PROT|nr:flavin reductase [Pokkaliibacter plantistimulans]PPC78720.1 flavin oxidoreductase [Pokkaliibacter plantistimulans]
MISEFDSKAFRRALGNFATGVTVITAATADGEKTGVTANSFNSVSLEPPLILWSIDKRSNSYRIFEQASHFAVNILAANQMDLSNHFARPRDDKFAGIRYDQGLGGAPLLPECAAQFQCERYQIIDGGDHWILLGKVVAFADAGRAPLLYVQGSYALSMPHTSLPGKEPKPTVMEAGLENRLHHNLYYLMTQALRAYQEDYQPRQLATGLRTSEARMLMVLERDRCLNLDALSREVNMPVSAVEAAATILQQQELIGCHEDMFALTARGTAQAESLWLIAQEEEERMFAGLSEQQLDDFRDMLKKLISR